MITDKIFVIVSASLIAHEAYLGHQNNHEEPKNHNTDKVSFINSLITSPMGLTSNQGHSLYYYMKK